MPRGDAPLKDPIRVSICVAHADTASDANNQAKRLPAYRRICEKYPSAKYQRRYVGTERQGAAGVWFVNFEVREK